MKIKNFCKSAVLSLFFVLAGCSCAVCCPNTYQITEEQLIQLETELNQLENNNNQLLILLDESTQDLNQAKKTSIILQQESQALKAQLTRSQNTVQNLQKQLSQLRTELKEAKTSIEIANDELEKLSKSFKEYEKDRAKTEGRLTTQRTIWQVLFGVAVVGAGAALAS